MITLGNLKLERIAMNNNSFKLVLRWCTYVFLLLGLSTTLLTASSGGGDVNPSAEKGGLYFKFINNTSETIHIKFSSKKRNHSIAVAPSRSWERPILKDDILHAAHGHDDFFFGYSGSTMYIDVIGVWPVPIEYSFDGSDQNFTKAPAKFQEQIEGKKSYMSYTVDQRWMNLGKVTATDKHKHGGLLGKTRTHEHISDKSGWEISISSEKNYFNTDPEAVKQRKEEEAFQEAVDTGGGSIWQGW